MLPRRSLEFMGLNAVRFLSLVSLILVFSSTIYVMVNNIKAVNAFDANGADDSDLEECDYIDGSSVPNQPAGVFWAVLASLLIIFQTIILFLSEVEWPAVFFDRYFPVLGSGFGLGALGIFQCLISTQILSHHVDAFPLVAAFFLFALGCLNMLLGLIYRQSAKERRSIASWRAQGTGVLPTHSASRPTFSPQIIGRPFTSENDRPDTAEFGTWKNAEKAGYGFGRQGEKAAGLKGFILQKPEESLPRYATPLPKHKRQDSAQSDDSMEDSHASRAKSPVFKSSATAI